MPEKSQGGQDKQSQASLFRRRNKLVGFFQRQCDGNLHRDVFAGARGPHSEFVVQAVREREHNAIYAVILEHVVEILRHTPAVALGQLFSPLALDVSPRDDLNNGTVLGYSAVPSRSSATTNHRKLHWFHSFPFPSSISFRKSRYSASGCDMASSNCVSTRRIRAIRLTPGA